MIDYLVCGQLAGKPCSTKETSFLLKTVGVVYLNEMIIATHFYNL